MSIQQLIRELRDESDPELRSEIASRLLQQYDLTLRDVGHQHERNSGLESRIAKLRAEHRTEIAKLKDRLRSLGVRV